MSNLWVNWRFGSWHLQIGPDNRFYIALVQNQYWILNKPTQWFERM